MEHLGSSSGESVKVFVRVRPPDPNLESTLGHAMCLDVTSDSTLTVYSKPDPKIFTFDHVAGKNITQEDVFSSVGRPIIDSCMHGYNGTIFAYGQTGSGKTFTMIGPPSDDSEDTFTHELRGIIPRSFEYLFSFINRNKQKYGDLVEFLCKCSFLEIYNEQVFDLLDPASTGLHLRENMKHGVYVDSLSEVSVSSAREAYQVLFTGWVNRKVASTSMNRESSRSHAVFTLSIESKKREAKDSVAKIRMSVLNLVDLAGSERQRDTQTAGLRLKEAGSINKSLSALGNVIMALVDIANGKSRHVHYRDSKLTFLLRDSLGGNAKTHLVANVHPSARCFGESLSTLNFARRAKMIRNKAVINEDASGNVLQLQAEIKRLKSLLEHYKSGSPTPSVLNSSLLSPPSPTPSDNRPGHDKTAIELKAMLAASMEARDRANIEKTEMFDEVERLKELNEKKDRFLQSTKMILKFRESHISNLEKARKKEFPEEASFVQDETNKMLREEIQQLKYLIEHHPDRTKLVHENQGLKADIKKLSISSTGGVKLEVTQQKQLARSHQYTLQLERQLRHYLAKGSVNGTSPMSGCLVSASPTKMTFENEGLQVRCKQLQEDLDTTRRTLHSEREEFHLRESKLEANLNASKKANAELQRSIEALKLKNSVEKATLNDIHMNTIKTILTPKREREQMVRNRSFSCSPNSIMRRADSAPTEPHPLVHRTSTTTTTTCELSSLSSPPATSTSKFPAILENSEGSFLKHENVPSSPLSPLAGNSIVTSLKFNSTPSRTPGSTPQAKKARLSRDPALSESDAEEPNANGMPLSKSSFSLSVDLDEDEIKDCEKEPVKSVEDLMEDGEETELDDSRIQGALTEELKRLQDRNRRLEQELEELERRVVHLSHAKGALEAQLEEVTHLSRVEREGYYEKERAYLEKMSAMASEMADLKSTNGVLESEVQDLRVCLKSADKELKEVRDEKKEEKRSYDTKITNYMQKINELERLYSMEESKYNRAVEELQNIQVETETLREEMTFKEHRIGELEAALKREKEQMSAQEGEMQGLLEKLAHEVETNTRLSMELQEGHNGKEELVATMNENLKLRGEVEKLEGELQNHLQAHKQQMEQTELTLNTLLRKKATDEAAIAGFVANIQELRSEKTMTECRLADLEQELEDSGKELGATLSKNDTLRGEMEEMKKLMDEQEGAYKRNVAKKEAEREIVLDDLDRMSDQYQHLNMRFEDQVRKQAATQGELDEVKRELTVSETEVKRLLHEKVEKRSSLSKGQGDGNEAAYDEEIKQLKWQLDQAADMIESYEQTREEKNNEIIRLKELVRSLEEDRETRDSQQGMIAELRYELNQRKQEEDALRSQFQEAKAEVDEIKVVSRRMDVDMSKISRENVDLQMKCSQLLEQVTALMEQIERYKTSEECLFQEKESVRSQLEMLHEEKVKLSKECEKLAKENAAITGHQNIRQKIQYHATVKIENAKLKEEVIQLHTRLKRKADQVDKLQTILTEKGLELYRSKNPKKIQTDQDQEQNFKENIRP